MAQPIAKLQENLLELLADSERLTKALDEFPVKPTVVPSNKPVEVLKKTCEQIVNKTVRRLADEEEDDDDIELIRMPSKTEISPIEDDDDDGEAEKKRIKLCSEE